MDNPQTKKKERLSAKEQLIIALQYIKPRIKHIKDNKKKFFYVNGTVVIITFVILFFIVKPYYESKITILPDYGNKTTTLSQLENLGALSGISFGQSMSTEVYEKLVHSESVLGPVIYAKYHTNKFKDSVNLITYFGFKIKANSPIVSRKIFIKVYDMLSKGRISTDLDMQTKILTIKVIMPEPQLSADVTNNVANSLDNYVKTKRKSYASEQRKYIEKRLTQVKDSLANAENDLKNFREQNRIVAQSPALLLEQDRLTRTVQIQQSVYIELNKQLEIAKIDEIKNTPIVNIEEYAKNPVIKAGPHRGIILVIVVFFSLIITGTYYLYKPEIEEYKNILKS